MKTFKLHLIRHGITAGNLQGLYIGSGTLVRKAAAPHWRLLRNAAVRNCGPAALSRA